MKLDDCPGFHDAVNEACTCGGGGPPDCCPACEVYHAVKDWEVAGPVVQPREQSPELAEAEKWLREKFVDRVSGNAPAILTAQLEKYQAGGLRLEGEAQRTVYTVADDELDATDQALGGCSRSPAAQDTLTAILRPGEHVYAVTLTAIAGTGEPKKGARTKGARAS